MEIVSYRPEHCDELLAFLRDHFPASPQKGKPNFFQWRFAESPLGSSFDHYHLAIENNRIVGQLAAIRDRIWAQGQWRDCFWLMDMIVAPEHRGPQSMAAPGLFREVMKKCSLLLATGTGHKFSRALRWQYREVAGTYFAIRRPGPLLALAGESSPWKSWLSLAAMAMTGLQSVRTKWGKHPEYELDNLDQFGAETDHLMERVLPSLPVTSHRSASYLNWKFNQRPEGTHFVITAKRKGESEIAGYMAVKMMERRPHARWAEIVDYLVEPGNPNVFDGLLNEATRQAVEMDVDFLRLRCSLPEHRDRLRAPFWILRNRPVIDGTFFRTEDAGLDSCLTQEPWHLTSLVSDRTDHGADEFTPPGAPLLHRTAGAHD